MNEWLPAPDHDGYWWMKEVYKANGQVKTLAPVWVFGTADDETMIFFVGAIPRKFPQEFAFEECVKFLALPEPEIKDKEEIIEYYY